MDELRTAQAEQVQQLQDTVYELERQVRRSLSHRPCAAEFPARFQAIPRPIPRPSLLALSFHAAE